MNIGDKFNLLTAIGFAKSNPNPSVEVRCDCGVVKVVDAYAMRIGKIKSCGCYGKAAREKANLKHGHNRRKNRTPLYNCWVGMMLRCYNEGSQDFPQYGGRGITVCEPWKDFSCFASDVGEKPVGRTIDRIDVNRGYEPGNVRWATDKEQARNKRNNRVLTLGNRSMCVAAWVEEVGLSSSLIINRIDYLGWSEEKALSTPARANKRQRG